MFVGATALLGYLHLASVWPNMYNLGLALFVDLEWAGWPEAARYQVVDLLNLMPLLGLAILAIAGALSVFTIVGVFRGKSVPGWVWMVLAAPLLIFPIWALTIKPATFAALGISGQIVVAAVFLLGGMAKQASAARIRSGSR